MKAKALAGAGISVCSAAASGSDGVVEAMKPNADGAATGG
jgi:hypothetical protein